MLDLTEQQRLEAIALCDKIQATIARIDAQFKEAKKAFDDLAAEWAAAKGEAP